MRAYQVTAANEAGVREVAEPRATTGEVVVSLRAAALNHRDLWIKRGQYTGLKWPCTPGSDGAGVVEAVGDGVDVRWIGREVIINPSFGWGEREPAQGAEFSILGLPRDGTLAEKVAVPVAQLTGRSEHLSWEQAAALPLAGLTAYRALRTRAQLQVGERVLVSGIGGGVALFALQFAIAMGAEVWVTSSSREKIARAITLGAKGGFNYTEAGWGAAALKQTGGFNVIVDGAGGAGFEQLIDAAAPGGRVVFYGATRGNPPALPMRKVFWRQLSLLGTTMGSPTDWAAMGSFVAEQKIVPLISEIFELAQANEAFALMERSAQFGKIVIRTR